MRANDAVNGAILIIFAAIMIALTASFPAFPGQKYGPSLFPRLLGAGLIICGALLVWRGLQARRAGERWLTPDPGPPTRASGSRSRSSSSPSCSTSWPRRPSASSSAPS